MPCDLTNLLVQEGKCWAKANGAVYMEMSAKSGSNVLNTFQTLGSSTFELDNQKIF